MAAVEGVIAHDAVSPKAEMAAPDVAPTKCQRLLRVTVTPGANQFSDDGEALARTGRSSVHAAQDSVAGIPSYKKGSQCECLRD